MEITEFKDKYFKNKKITKQGFGILGRGLGTVKFLLKNDAEVLVTDLKPEIFFQEQLTDLRLWMKENDIPTEKVKFIFGEHRLIDFENCDFVISASGVPKDNVYLNFAKNKNIPVYQESTLFLKIINDFNGKLENKENRIKIITVTGTRGKTTTTHLIFKILKDFYKDRNVYFGGNIQGISTVELLDRIKEKDLVVMETDSWLAQGFESIKFAPDIAVFTNFMKDHMNYYKGNMDEYFSDKAQTFLYQNENSTLISTEDFEIYVAQFLNSNDKKNFENLKSKKVFLTKLEIEKDKENFLSPLQGEHNRINISLAIKVAEALKIPENDIKISVRSFNGVSGRLELVKEINGVKYINDTTATTPDATIVALKTFQENKHPIILIFGGTDKELEVKELSKKLISNKNQNLIKQIILLKDATTTGSEKIIKELESEGFTDYKIAVNLKEAISFANNNCKTGEIILFSPGFASFGMFANEYHRGEMFVKFINETK